MISLPVRIVLGGPLLAAPFLAAQRIADSRVRPNGTGFVRQVGRRCKPGGPAEDSSTQRAAEGGTL